MEDVDAASPIVMSRAGPTDTKTTTATTEAPALQKQSSSSKEVSDTVGVATSDDAVLVGEGGAGEGADLMMAVLNSLTDSSANKTSGVLTCASFCMLQVLIMCFNL
jgi:hypothetical protein